MIKIIAGNKGSGKTKRLIDLTNQTAKDAIHDVVFIDDDNRYMFDLRHEVRFVNAGEYGMRSADMFFGFLCGMLASNYDISTIFVDAFLKLVKIDVAESGWFFESLESYGKKHDVTFVLSVSADPEALPEFCKSYVI